MDDGENGAAGSGDGQHGAGGSGDGQHGADGGAGGREIPDDWVVWSESDGGRLVLAYRPDVFDSEKFPAPCLPTVTVTPRHPDQRPGAGDDRWHVACHLEPQVRARALDDHADTRDGAVAAALSAAERFAAGEVDPGEVYQVPREAYVAELRERLGFTDGK